MHNTRAIRTRCFWRWIVLATAATMSGLTGDLAAAGFEARIAVADSVVPGDTVAIQIAVVPDSTVLRTRLGQLELSLHLDSTVFTLYDVKMPDELLDHGWAPPRFYFAHAGELDCGSAQLTLVLVADQRWIEPTADTITAISINLVFVTTKDVTLFGDTSSIDFCWRTCNDNCFYDTTEDTSYIAREVFDHFGNRLSDLQMSLPTITGPPQICHDAVVPVGKSREATVDFYNGAVIFVSRGGLSEPGDIDLDGAACEPSDLTLLGSHCLIGDDAYQIDVERQHAVSDIDGDGVGGSVADWVALRYIVSGEINPEVPRVGQPMAHLHFAHQDKFTEVYLDADVAANAFSLWFATASGNIDSVHFSQGFDPGAFEAALTVTRNNRLHAAFSAGSSSSPSIPAGFNRILTVYHDENAMLTPIHVEAATAEPRLFAVDVATSVEPSVANDLVPVAFTLQQNYPNPFNPGTAIRFDLRTSSHWRLEIFDIRGRCIRVYAGSSQSGPASIFWDGYDSGDRPAASGVYLYRLTAGGSQETRKMLLVR